MTLTDDIAFLGIAELSERLRTKKFSPVDLTEFFLARIERLAPKLNCFLTVTRNVALEQAARARAEIGAGKWRGPLHGIPYGLKDLVDTKGIKTTFGAKPFADRVPPFDATVYRKLQDAGAVLVGKLSMVELAGGFGYTWPDSAINGACATPWDLKRWAGGSSSGSGSAVAAGLVPFAIGSETWGSIVCPASFCGVTGHRPTYGAVSRHGAMALSYTLDKIGPIARSAEDCRWVLEAIAGKDPLDASSIDLPRQSITPARIPKAAPKSGDGSGRILPLGVDLGRSANAAAIVTKPKSEWRVARIGFPAGTKVDPAISKAFDDGVAVFRNAGVVIEDAVLPDFPWEEMAILFIIAESRAAFADLIASGGDRQLAARAHGDWEESPLVKNATAIDYVKGMRIRTAAQQALDAMMAPYDFLLTPGFPVVAPPIDASFAKLLDFPDPVGAAGNLAGLPACAVPCGFAGPGTLPVAMQVVGRPFEDAAVLAAAAFFQSKTDWHTRRPPE